MTRLVDLASYIRSKNDGPFILTFDVGFEDNEAYQQVVAANVITSETVAGLYGIPEEDIIAIYNVDKINTIKITLKRNIPACHPKDRDILGAQQYKPLLDLEI